MFSTRIDPYKILNLGIGMHIISTQQNGTTCAQAEIFIIFQSQSGVRSSDGSGRKTAYYRRIVINCVLFYQWQSQMNANASNLFEQNPKSIQDNIFEDRKRKLEKSKQ